jgi:hypothetical protein
MKKNSPVLIVLLIGFMFCQLSNAQEVGIRFGDVSGGNVAVDGVFGINKFSRIHADVSFGDGVGIDLLWDFLYKPLGDEALNWYLGGGPYTFLGDPFQLGLVAEAGLEYRFNEVPLVIGADWRPWFRLVDNTDVGFNGFGINVRWAFGKGAK